MTKRKNSENLESVEPEANCSASKIPAGPSSDAPSISGQPDAVENTQPQDTPDGGSPHNPRSDAPSLSGQPDAIENTQPQDTPDGGSPHKMNEESTGPRKVPRSTGPRTLQGKRRSARNASKHKILVGRILPEESNAAYRIWEELAKDLNPRGMLAQEIVLDLVLNRIQRRRIDTYGITSIVQAREHCVDNFVNALDQGLAEPWLRFMDTRSADSVVRKRLTPEACIDVLDRLSARLQERGPSPEEDIKVLGCVYGQEYTDLGAIIVFHYQLIKAGHYKRDEKDEKRKVEYEELRDKILKALEREIQFHRDRVERKTTIVKAEYSASVMVPSPSVAESIQRYLAANAREFSRLLDDLERVRRLQKG